MVILQVDDTLAVGTHTSMDEEGKAATAFMAKPRRIFTEEAQIFNGVNIVSRGDGVISINHAAKIYKLDMPNTQK